MSECGPECDGDEYGRVERVCPLCSFVWLAIHCVHDGVQNPCPNCGVRPSGRSPLQFLGLVPDDLVP